MKLPRWLVISMLTLSVLAVLAAPAWWWVTWPERTAREFVELLGTDKLEGAQAMMGQEEIEWTASRGESVPVRVPSNWGEVETKPRSLMDLLACTGQYGIPHAAYYDRDFDNNWKEWTFTARRGRIVDGNAVKSYDSLPSVSPPLSQLDACVDGGRDCVGGRSGVADVAGVAGGAGDEAGGRGE